MESFYRVISVFLIFGLLVQNPTGRVYEKEQYLAPKTALQGAVYMAPLELPKVESNVGHKLSKEVVLQNLIVAIKEFPQTLRPIRFLLSHDNSNPDGSINLKALKQRLIGISFIYASMIAAPFNVGIGLANSTQFDSVFITLISLLSIPVVNIVAHFVYNLIAKLFNIASLTTFLPLQSDEIAVTRSGLQFHFIGKSQRLVKELREALDKESELSANAFEIELEKIKYIKRLSGKNKVWSFKEKFKEKLGESRGWELRTEEKFDLEELGPEEIGVSKRGFNPYFLGNVQKFAKELNEALDKESLLSGNALEVELEGIKYIKRESRGHQIWSFKKDSTRRLSVARSWELRPEEVLVLEKLGPEEIAVTQSGLKPYFRGDFSKLTKELVEALDEEFLLSGNALEVELEGIKYTKRKNGGHQIWSFKKELKFQVSAARSWELRAEESLEELGPGEIGVSKRGFKPYFRGDSSELAKELGEALDKESLLSGNTIEVELEGIKYTKRKNGRHQIWSFKKELKFQVSAARSWELRAEEGLEELGPGEIGVSKRGFKPYFRGDSSELAKELGEALDKESLLSGNTIEVELEGIKYTKRKNGRHQIWSFKKELKFQVSAARSWELRAEESLEELGPEEIAVSGPGLQSYFIGDFKNRSKELREALDKESLLSGNALEVELEGLTYIKRQSGANQVWSFKKENKYLVARSYGWTLRENDAEIQDKIEEFDLSSALVLLGNDPLRLHQYLTLTHPDLSDSEIQKIISVHSRSLSGLKAEWGDKEELHQGYEVSLEVPQLTSPLSVETDEYSLTIEGKTDPSLSYVQVTGAYTRKIQVRQDGTFFARVPIPRVGEVNLFSVYGVNEETEQKSASVTIEVNQTAEKQDTEEALLALLSLKQEVLDSIRKNPGRYQFMLRSVELATLKQFTYDEQAGLNYLREKIAAENSALLRTIYEAVLDKFEEIVELKFPLKEGRRLYFFQKYVVWEILKLKKEGRPGFINAMEQGLGKTITTLVAINSDHTAILTPNSVVTSWAEQEELFFDEANLTVLEGSHAERFKELKALKTPQIVTNIEFSRGMTAKRAELLSKKANTLVVDEADYLVSASSQQSKGTAEIQAEFKLLLSATPFRKVSHIARLLEFLYPGDVRFKSAKAFIQAFPIYSPDPEKARAAFDGLFLLLSKHMIRIRKKDVFEEYDPAIPLEEQSDKLPRKVEIVPDDERANPEKLGQYTLSNEQSRSILELFTQYQEWCGKHKGFESDEDKSFHKFKEGYFSKAHALRQIENNPVYIGEDEIDSPKHQAMDKIVEKEIGTNEDRKMLVFVRYRSEVESYYKRYPQYGVRTYYGDLPQNANGYKIDQNKRVEYFKVDKFGNYILENNQLVTSNKKEGKPIRALDYERIVFQKDPNSRILVATYDAGSVGVTLTAADVVVYSDLAQTYRDQYQAGDRAHRIDNERKKYNVKYYWLQALYPQEFLDSLDKETRETYFDVGTWDQVHLDNLRRQKQIFHMIMDGVADEETLIQMNRKFMKERMPFLFANGKMDDEVDESNDQENSAPTISEETTIPFLKTQPFDIAI